MYNRPMTYLTRWATVGTVVTILLNGCASTPPTPIPTPIPETPQVGTGTSSNPDAGSASGNVPSATVTLPSNPLPSSVGSTSPTPPAATPPSSSACHKVVRGDTLYSISKHYGHTVAELAKWNGIKKPYNLKIGQLLQVSSDASCQ